MDDIMFFNQSDKETEHKEEIKGQPLRHIVGAAVGVAALVWWCVLYPELCFPQDTYEVVYGTGAGEELKAGAGFEAKDDYPLILQADDEQGDYPKILQADDEQIVISSKLLEWLSQKID